MLTDLQNQFRTGLVSSAGAYLKTFDPASGRFLAANGGWALTLQDPMLAYAYLYTTPFEGNPYYRSGQIYDVILAAVRALRAFQYPDGQMEFIKTDGSTWGPIYMPWTFYHWLECYALMRDHLPEELRLDWEKGLMPAFLAFAGRENKEVHNIPVWDAMSLHRAGQLFERPDWQQHADAMMRLTVETQHPDGYWEEHDGPTVGYNFVYLHALGLYRFHGGVEDVSQALLRSARFHQVFTYPDGSQVETIDGRVKYHRQGRLTSSTGFPGFLASRAGVRYIEFLGRHFDYDRLNLPHATSFLQMLEGIGEDYPLSDEGYEHFDDTKAALIHGKGGFIRNAGRQAVLSAYTIRPKDSRWSLDRQSFASVWDEKAGLVLGSGNSKWQPLTSSFVVSGRDGQVVSYMPTRGELVAPDELRLRYYGFTGIIRSSITGSGEVTLTYSGEYDEELLGYGDSLLSWRVNLPLKTTYTEGQPDLSVTEDNGTVWVSFAGVTLRFRGEYVYQGTVRPFSPYVKDGVAPLEEALEVVTIIPRDGQVTVVLQP